MNSVKLVRFILTIFVLFILYRTNLKIVYANISKEVFATYASTFCNGTWINPENTIGPPDLKYGSVTLHDPVCSWIFQSFNIPAYSTINKLITKVYNSPSDNAGVSSMSPMLSSVQTCVPPPFWPATLYNGVHEYVVTPQNCPTSFPTLQQINSGFLGWAFFNSGKVNLQTDAISMQIDYTPPAVTPTPTPTPIADFKQTDPQWSTMPVLPVNTNTHLNHSEDCGDMYGFGCAVTSTADVLFYYGKTTLPDSAILNPGNLNGWLTANSGFNSSCSINWGIASTASKIGAPQMIFRNGSSDWTDGKQAIDDALTKGNLPILGIITQYGTHFLAVSEKLPDVNGKPDYKLVDPALYPFSASSSGNTGLSLNQKYGGFDNTYETVIYIKGSTPQNTLTIRGHSPIQLLITDPNGKTTGYNSSTQTVIENIPNSAYGIEGGIAPVDGESLSQSETKYFQQINPTQGKYLLKIIGTGTGNYKIDLSKTDVQGNVATQEISGSTIASKIEVYSIQYSPSAYDPISVERVDTTPPTTYAALYGIEGSDNWYRSSVQIYLNATDNDGGSGVNHTVYRINGSEFSTYTDPIAVTADGDYTVDFYSVDNAGNIENTETKSFHIDTTPPLITLSVDKSYLWPPNGKLIPVIVNSAFTDRNLSSKMLSLQDEYSEIFSPISEGEGTIYLKAYRRDDDFDGRLYTITAYAEDKAGNASQHQEYIVVLHDKGN